MRGLLGEDAAIVRAMPNTPAAIAPGFTVAFAGTGVTAAQRALADRLLPPSARWPGSRRRR